MRQSRGFTMIELMVALAIVALLAALAAPTARGMIANGRIRSIGESMSNGLSLARAEAVRLNTPVAFVRSPLGWSVSRIDTPLVILHGGTGRESAGTDLTLTNTPADATMSTFDSFGRLVNPNPDGTNAITRIDIEAQNSAGISNYRPLRIQVLASGLTRLCDPALAGTEPRACL